MSSNVGLIWSKIETWYGTQAPAQLNQLAPPATASQIESLDLLVGQAIPPDYRESLQRHNGGGFIHGSDYLDVDWIKAIHGQLMSRYRQGLFNGFCPADDSGRVFAPVWWSEHWLPIAQHRAGSLTCLDLFPGAEGILGQVLQLELPDEGPTNTLWTDFGSWLDQYRVDLESGKYAVDTAGNLNRCP